MGPQAGLLPMRLDQVLRYQSLDDDGSLEDYLAGVVWILLEALEVTRIMDLVVAPGGFGDAEVPDGRDVTRDELPPVGASMVDRLELASAAAHLRHFATPGDVIGLDVRYLGTLFDGGWLCEGWWC